MKAQKDFAPALKSSLNPHFKSKYCGLDGCIEAVIDALNENGIGLVQRTFDDTSGVTVETVFIHESGESLECGKLHVPASKNDAQGYGSALTYARRYSLMAACGIAPEDDDGQAASKPVQQSPKITAKQKAEIIAMVTETATDLSVFVGYLKLSKIDDLPASDYLAAIHALEQKRAAIKKEKAE